MTHRMTHGMSHRMTTLNKQNKTKQKKKCIKKSFDDILLESGLSQKITLAFKDFIEMRKLIKKPMTSRALELSIKDLNALSNDEETQVKIIEQSIKKNWQGLFPLKDNFNNKNQAEWELIE